MNTVTAYPPTAMMNDCITVLSVADDTLAPHGFEPVGSFVVSGPPASGRTNALKALVTAVERFDPDVRMYHFGSRRAELKDFRPWVRSATRPEDEKDLAAELAEFVVSDAPGGRIRIVIEELDKIDQWGKANRNELAAELAQIWGIPKPVVDTVVGRSAFGTGPITRSILGEQQQIADTFFDLKLIPKRINVLEAAAPGIA